MTCNPTGRRENRDGTDYVAYARTFRAPIEDVWAAVTEPARLERWIGTWTGDPATGRVDFQMTAEGDEAPVEVYRIDVCEPPRRLVTRSQAPGDEFVWLLELDLTHTGGVTTLRFAQRLSDPEMASSVGPGWDYYLDRLVAAETAADVSAVDFDDYYPSQSDHYRNAFG